MIYQVQKLNQNVIIPSKFNFYNMTNKYIEIFKFYIYRALTIGYKLKVYI